MTGIRGFFDVECMVPQNMRRGALPSNRDAYRRMCDIALPSVLEMALMSMISMADTMMVSTLGTEAITAVSLVTQPRLILLCIFYGLNAGVTAIIARRKGEDRRADANLAMRNSLVITLLLSIVITLLALWLAEPFMRLAGANETMEDTLSYFRIIAMALPINALSLCICAAQRGVGNTRLTMYVNVTSNLVNVLFNWLLINGVGPFSAPGDRRRGHRHGYRPVRRADPLRGFASSAAAPCAFFGVYPARFLEAGSRGAGRGIPCFAGRVAGADMHAHRLFPLCAHCRRIGRICVRRAQHRHAVFETCRSPLATALAWRARRWSASRWAKSGRISLTCTARSPSASRCWRR